MKGSTEMVSDGILSVKSFPPKNNVGRNTKRQQSAQELQPLPSSRNFISTFKKPASATVDANTPAFNNRHNTFGEKS